jgi:tetratricopeptide (TPR) repeat protein
MSYYAWGGKLSYQDYLTAHSFASDISSAAHDAGQRISMKISQQTREVIASNEALARDNIRAVEASGERIVEALADGFSTLSYDLQEISAGISELNATFHWGFGQMIAGIGRMNDSLEALVKIAKTPVQTLAFNHFEIARDAFRQGLYREAFEELDKAIQGDHTSPGYKLEWRFHHLHGIIRLGFADCDLALVDLGKAEDAFLKAARYAQRDYPEDAGRAFLSAGWAAYCQGKLKEALAYTEQAIAVHPCLGEAFFQAAKVRMAMDQADSALPILAKAIDIDRFFALKAAGDGDFQKYDERVRMFLDALRKEKYGPSVPKVKAAIEKIQFWRDHSSEAQHHEATFSRMLAFLNEGARWPLFDMLAVIQGLDVMVRKIRSLPIAIQVRHPGKVESIETYPEEETYQERVLIRKAGLFRKEQYDVQTKTRTVMKTRTVTRNVRGQIVSLCSIPAGNFMMGSPNDEKGRRSDEIQHQVTISYDFLIGKYPVSRRLWAVVMGGDTDGLENARHPVHEVSWEQCQTFISKLNEMTGSNCFRLPTEAEWEYACRAGSTGAYCFGNDERELGDYTWYGQFGGWGTHPLGQKKPNAWGLYDVHGNVWEWCEDFEGIYPSGHVIDPHGPSSGSRRVLRGGDGRYDASYCRAAVRNYCPQDAGMSGYGFRLARTL